MNLFNCCVLLFALCGVSGLLAKKVRLRSRHNLVKRQADYHDHNSQTNADNQQRSNSDQDGASSSRRHFVSPDGEPYYEYQPPVSTSREASGGRSATSHVTVGGGSGRAASVPVYSSEVRRSRTYTYPFGRERTQYLEQQAQTDGGQTPGSVDDTGSSSAAGAQHEGSGSRRYRQTQYYSSSNQRSTTYDQDRSRQNPSNQQARNDAEAQREQELRRRQEELRRRHEEERRRQEEERRIQEEERRVQEEERRRESEARRRQYYEQQQQQQQQRQQQQQQQQQTQTTTEVEDAGGSEQTTTSVYQAGSRTDPRQQPGYTGYSQQRVASGQQQPVSGQSSPHQSVYDSSGQTGVYRTAYGQQPQQQQQPQPQGGYVPTNQQSVYRTNSQTQYYPLRQQQPVYSSVSRTVTSQQPVYRSTSTTYRQGTQVYPNQQTRVFYQQPGQVDPRLVAGSQGGVYPGFRTQYEYSSGSQGQGFYDPYSNPYYIPDDTGAGAFLPYGTQNAFSECPETGIDLRINGMNCQQAVQHHGDYLCYAHEYTSRECCEICRPRKQASRIGCEYGDHAALCSEITPADCYDLRNRQSCCESCERFRRNDAPAGCEYGDMTVRCEDVRQNPGLCYIPDNQRLCCETCNRIRNATNPGCPWGDYNTNLCQVFDEHSSGVRINCYSPQRRRMCCESCERLRSWLPNDLPADCPYGDRPVIFSTGQFGRLNCSSIFTVFTTEECRTNQAVAVNCCHTCHRYLRGRG